MFFVAVQNICNLVVLSILYIILYVYLNLTQNSMKTRHTEKYVVYHAHTERLKNSKVPYLQKILNDYEISKLANDSPV